MRNLWTEEQIDWLKKNYSEKGIKECAGFLKRSQCEIKRKAGSYKLYLRSRWTEQKTQFLRDNYAEKGTEFCAKELNTTRNSINFYAQQLSLRLSPETKSRLLKKVQPKQFSDYDVNPNNFMDNISAESAYMLGLLWADGHIYKPTNTKNNYRINLVCRYDDIDNIRAVIQKTGKWHFKEFETKNIKHKPYTMVYTNNRHLHKFLTDNDYTIKSGADANKILTHVPLDLHRYFFLGLIDGDGCWFYKRYKYDQRRFFIASTYDQNWQFVENLFNHLNINYTIRRKVFVNGRSSEIGFAKRLFFRSLYDYLWPNNFEFGFSRKYQKAKEAL